MPASTEPAAAMRTTVRPPVDAVLSIAEGRATRNREGWVPSLLEMAAIPLLGSDALVMPGEL